MPNSTKVDTLGYYDKERKSVNDQYKTDLAALDRNKNVQMQEAAINNELLKKYLPQMNQMSGLSGLGVSESANIDALSRYQNTVTDINRGYRESVDSLDRYRNADLASINAEERKEQREDQQTLDLYKREDQSEAYQMASMQIMGATSASEIDEILEAWEGETNEAQYANLVAYAESRKASLTATEKEVVDSMGSTAAPGTVDGSGGTVKIPIPTQDGVGLKLDLSILGETDFQEAIDAGAKRENGEVFVYDKAIYFKSNDRVYELADPEGNNNSDVYSAIYGYLKNNEVIPAADPIKKFFDDVKSKRDEIDAEKSKTGAQNSVSPDEEGKKEPNKKQNFVEVVDPDEGEFVFWNEYGKPVAAKLRDASRDKLTSSQIAELQKAGDGVAIYMANGYGTYGHFVIIDGTIYSVTEKEA